MPAVFKTVEFINADEIAQGLSPLNVDSVAFQAGRIMLERLDYFFKKKKSFAFETTLSGLGYLKLIQQAKMSGFEIIFFFVWLDSFELAKAGSHQELEKADIIYQMMLLKGAIPKESETFQNMLRRQTTGIFMIIQAQNTF